METENIYWTAVAALFGAVWALVIFIRDRNSSAAESRTALMSRLLEIDKLLIEHPEIQKYMSSTATKTEAYFRDPGVLEDELFYKAKTFAYFHINIFDELLSLATQSRVGPKFLMPPGVIELSDWEAYIRRKLSHPLYRSILNNESEMFGAPLRAFWTTIKKSLDAASPNPFAW